MSKSLSVLLVFPTDIVEYYTKKYGLPDGVCTCTYTTMVGLRADLIIVFRDPRNIRRTLRAMRDAEPGLLPGGRILSA